MTKDNMAQAIHDGLGHPPPIPDEVRGMCQAIIDELAISLVSNAPGTITGVAPSSGGPLIGGVGSGGIITGISGATLAAKMKTEMSKPSITSELLGMATAISTHIMSGSVSFSLVTGICGNSATSPGPLVGEGAGGKVGGLNGSTLATLMASSMGKPGTTPELIGMCTGLVDYIMTNADVNYSTGTVTGTCPAGGGPITVGAGSGGTIS